MGCVYQYVIVCVCDVNMFVIFFLLFCIFFVFIRVNV